MSTSPRILAFSGSTRTASFNKKLVAIAAEGARAAGAEVTLLDLRDFALPLYDEDLETSQGLPENVLKLKKLFIESHGFLISSPEYNSSISAVLKNVIDWVSRPNSGEAPLAGFQGKAAALLATSPGALGGLRGLVHLRAILGNIGVIVLPDQVAIVKAGEAFAADNSLKDPKQAESVKKLGATLTKTLIKLNA